MGSSASRAILFNVGDPIPPCGVEERGALSLDLSRLGFLAAAKGGGEVAAKRPERGLS
ncbi:hypothetical protein MesoLjLa_34400 [Mesorhizobium sp. L-2-11]|nr:hypothetical protein MesoLjLa_34400 [Mesorhizobium sp. L-2-11]